MNPKSFLIVSLLALSLSFPSLASAQTPTPAKNWGRIIHDQIDEKRIEIKNQIQQKFNSFVHLYSVKLDGKTDTTLTVDKDGKTYTVNISGTTQLRRRFWGTASISEFQTGDMLNIQGIFTDDAHTVIDAKLIRDLSIQKRFGVFIGEITTINGNAWTVKTAARGDQQVTVDGNTKFVNRREESISQSDIKVGHRVRIRGLWDRNANTITGVSIVKDFSLPIIPSPTPKHPK